MNLLKTMFFKHQIFTGLSALVCLAACSTVPTAPNTFWVCEKAIDLRYAQEGKNSGKCINAHGMPYKVFYDGNKRNKIRDVTVILENGERFEGVGNVLSIN